MQARNSGISRNNHRRMPDGKITVRNHLVLVGPNGTGKSSVTKWSTCASAWPRSRARRRDAEGPHGLDVSIAKCRESALLPERKFSEVSLMDWEERARRQVFCVA